MVIYTGIDTEMISRFAHLWEKKPALLKKIFFPSELSYFANQGYHIATLTGIWCAKEAVVKAVYPTIRLHIREVEIIAQKKEPPAAVLHNKQKRAISPDINVSISIAHSRDYATAIAVHWLS